VTYRNLCTQSINNILVISQKLRMRNIVKYEAKECYYINFKVIYLVIITVKTEQQDEWIRKYMCDILVAVTLHIKMN